MSNTWVCAAPGLLAFNYCWFRSLLLQTRLADCVKHSDGTLISSLFNWSMAHSSSMHTRRIAARLLLATRITLTTSILYKCTMYILMCSTILYRNYRPSESFDWEWKDARFMRCCAHSRRTLTVFKFVSCASTHLLRGTNLSFSFLVSAFHKKRSSKKYSTNNGHYELAGVAHECGPHELSVRHPNQWDAAVECRVERRQGQRKELTKFLTGGGTKGIREW